MSHDARTHLFLYGTLMRGCCNDRHVYDQQFIGEVSTVPGYRLYTLTGYPGMVPDSSDTVGVLGELWKVDADCLARLNRFEGTDLGLYRLATVPLCPPFDQIEALTYLYLHSITGRDMVTGRWREGSEKDEVRS